MTWSEGHDQQLLPLVWVQRWPYNSGKERYFNFFETFNCFLVNGGIYKYIVISNAHTS